MKTLFIVALSLVAFTTTAQNKKEKAPFPQQIIKVMESKDFEISIDKIIGLPATISNRETPPTSYVTLEGDKIYVALPYYDKNNVRRQGIYNFSDFGRMLTFDTNNVTIRSSRLNKKGTIYTMQIDTYGTQTISFPVTLSISVHPSGTVNVSANWKDYNVQYSGVLVSDK